MKIQKAQCCVYRFHFSRFRLFSYFAKIPALHISRFFLLNILTVSEFVVQYSKLIKLTANCCVI